MHCPKAEIFHRIPQGSTVIYPAIKRYPYFPLRILVFIRLVIVCEFIHIIYDQCYLEKWQGDWASQKAVGRFRERILTQDRLILAFSITSGRRDRL